MRKILQFLATEGFFLFEDHNFRFVDSHYWSAFGGSGTVVLASDVLDIRFAIEREHRIFMDFRATGRTSPNSWFSIDIVRQLLTGEIDRSYMDDENTAFLNQRFHDVQVLFSKDRLDETEVEFKKLEKKRSKRLFG